jgi:hypothetical protein
MVKKNVCLVLLDWSARCCGTGKEANENALTAIAPPGSTTSVLVISSGRVSRLFDVAWLTVSTHSILRNFRLVSPTEETLDCAGEVTLEILLRRRAR